MERVIRAPRGNERTCKGWIQEAALRMLMNNLDPEVAEREPEDLPGDGLHATRLRMRTHSTGISTIAFR